MRCLKSYEEFAEHNENTMRKARLLMVLRETRTISTFPIVINSARMWSAARVQVDIFTDAEIDVDGVFASKHAIGQSTFPFAAFKLRSLISASKYDFVVAYNPIDAEMAAFATTSAGARFIYHNSELRYPTDIKFAFHNCLERRFAGKCSVIISQDKLRLAELSRLLGTQNSDCKLFLVPNTYAKPTTAVANLEPNPRDPRFKRTLYYAGAIQEKKIPEAVVAGIIEKMPENWALLLSGWSVDGHAQKLLARFSSTGRLRVNLGVVSSEEYQRAVETSTAGLVWYDGSNDVNELNVGLSSGKFWRHVTLAKRVLVKDLPYLGDFVRENDLGVVIAGPEQLTTEHFAQLLRPVVPKDEFYFDYHYLKVIQYLMPST